MNNQLNAKKSYALTVWLSNQDTATKQLTRPELAEKATAALGFTVTAHNITGVEEVLGIVRRRSKPKDEVAELKEWIKSLEARVTSLENYVTDSKATSRVS